MNIFLKLALAGSMALASVAPALALNTVKAGIPFAFNVGSKAMPAGEYEVQPLPAKSLALRNLTTHDDAVAIIMTASPSESSGRASLVFHRYGDSYFLAETRESAQNAARSSDVRVEALAK